MSGFLEEFGKAAKQGVSLYFSPLLGFLSGIKLAWEKMEVLGNPDENAVFPGEDDCRRIDEKPRPPGVNP